MRPSDLADNLRLAAITAELLNASHSAQCDRVEQLEKELASRPTVWAYQQACKALDHWRGEAKRLGELAGVEPRTLQQATTD
jgi:hypothetical protein